MKPATNRPSVEEQRSERLLQDITKDNVIPPPLSDKSFVPKSVFEKNVSPSLRKPD